MKKLISLDRFEYDNEKIKCPWADNEIYDSMEAYNFTSVGDVNERLRMDVLAAFHKQVLKKVKLKMKDELTFGNIVTGCDYYRDARKLVALWSVHTVNILYDDAVMDEMRIMVYFNRILGTKRFYLNDLKIAGGNSPRDFIRYIRACGKFKYDTDIDANGSRNLIYSNHVARNIDNYIRGKKKKARDLILKRENDRLETIKMKKFIDNVF